METYFLIDTKQLLFVCRDNGFRLSASPENVILVDNYYEASLLGWAVEFLGVARPGSLTVAQVDVDGFIAQVDAEESLELAAAGR